MTRPPSSTPAIGQPARRRRASPSRSASRWACARCSGCSRGWNPCGAGARCACGSTRAFARATTCCCCAPSTGSRRARWRSGGHACRRSRPRSAARWPMHSRTRAVRRGQRAARAAGVAAGPGPPPRRDGIAAMEIWRPAYIGLGSNLADPRAQVLTACARLAQLPRTRVVLSSRLYRSHPLGPIAQPDFVNAVVGVLTQLESPALLAALRALEAALGRPAQRERWGPRIIDLDLLSYAREQRSEAALTLPHAGIVERNFVLYPLADIAPACGSVSAASERCSRDRKSTRLNS